MKSIIIIPARLASSRLPNKVLADINGKSMIRHVFDRAIEANIGPVLIATPDKSIVDIVNGFNGQAVLTGSHNSGTDRIYEAIEKIDPDHEYEHIVNLQGDMPFINPAHIQAITRPLSWEGTDITTLISRMSTLNEDNPSVVKCIIRDGDAIDFSRSFMAGRYIHYHHHGLYAYNRNALKRFVSLPQSNREKSESLEQLRALDNDMIIRVVKINDEIISVDTAEDLKNIRKE